MDQELYEPMWDDLYKAMKERGQPIRSIWVADVAPQGVSGMLNEEKLGNDRELSSSTVRFTVHNTGSNSIVVRSCSRHAPHDQSLPH